MKKLIIIAAMAACTAFAAAPSASVAQEKTVDPVSNTLALARAFVTNDSMRAEWFMMPQSIATNHAACAELDGLLAAKPPLHVLTIKSWRDQFPRTAEAAKTYYANSKSALIKFLECGEKWSMLTRAEGAQLIVERFYAATSPEHVDRFRHSLSRSLAKLIVPALRRQGKAVVTGPDGVNPVKVFSDRISTAINAPRFNGLNAILDELGVNANIDFDVLRLPADADIPAIKEKLMNDEVNEKFVPRTLGRLSVVLGVDQFNAFVETYNGGTR